jgi:hypothetical protein
MKIANSMKDDEMDSQEKYFASIVLLFFVSYQ